MDPNKASEPTINPLKQDTAGIKEEVKINPEEQEPIVSTPANQPVLTTPVESAVTPTPIQTEPPAKKTKTPLIIFIVLILLLTIAGLTYVFVNFSSKNKEETIQPTPVQQVTIPQPTITNFFEDSQTETLKQQGVSDEVEAIEQDLKNTDFTNLDKEIDLIEGQL